MQWIYQNINHLTVPLGVLFGIFAMIVGGSTFRSRRNGTPLPNVSRPVRFAVIVAILVGCVLLGIALAHNAVQG